MDEHEDETPQDDTVAIESEEAETPSKRPKRTKATPKRGTKSPKSSSQQSAEVEDPVEEPERESSGNSDRWQGGGSGFAKGRPLTSLFAFILSALVVEELEQPAFKQVRQAVRKSFSEAHQNNLPFNTMLQMVRHNGLCVLLVLSLALFAVLFEQSLTTTSFLHPARLHLPLDS